MQDGTGGKEGDAPPQDASATPDAKDGEEAEDIPAFVDGNQSMAMFAPLEESLFEPFDAPKTNLDRLNMTLKNLEQHVAAVQENIRFVYDRERRRILQYAKALEAAEGVVETDVGLAPQDERLMLNYVEAPIPAGADYSNRHLRNFNPPAMPPLEVPPRQAAIMWSLYNAGQGLVQLDGHYLHAFPILEGYQEEIAKETAAKESQRSAWTG